MAVNEAIILAGGLGTRLRQAVPDLPKCMAPVNGKPFLAFVINDLHRQGIDHFIFSLGYRHEAITDYLQQQFSTLSYSLTIEREPLGTGGAIKKACTAATGNTVAVANGDTLFAVSVQDVLRVHEANAAACTLSLKPMINFSRYGVVEIGDDQRVLSFKEKQFYEAGLINGGLYLLDRKRFLEEALPEKFSFEAGYLEQYFCQRHMYGVVQPGYFIDIGIPDDYARAQQELL